MTDKPQDERRQLILDYTKQQLPSWVKEVIEAHLLIEAEDAKSAGAIGYMTRALVISTMPYKDPKTEVFSRRNGDLSLRIVAGYEGGIPYGIYPRLLLAWLTTEAVRRRSRVIELGDSLSSFLRDVLEIKRGGGARGSSTRVAEQMKRLFGSMVNVSTTNEAMGNRFRLKNVTIADEADFDASQFDLYRESPEPELVGLDGTPLRQAGDDETLLWTPQTKDTAGAWRSHVTLTQNFYNECIDRPVPIDMRAYRALRRAPLAMDIYTWLTYRMSYTDRKTRPIPWQALMGQFGSNYTTERSVLDFKKGFLKALKLVQVTYPNARIQIEDKGLVLLPSPTHVPRAFTQGELTFGGS
ncbi:hypothetical protein PS623_04588 [Pseudomonas fluorescens]|uniref:replication protein RepA n=1 Tax=Pseudomonas fluorescens TaxID=294 RepID=UPI00123EDC67|nr:replication protein RepA [Pseudomonas fluorescens]VVN27036.1 hypothetical protein PS623_04588 [Pseudomonas fluorescens]